MLLEDAWFVEDARTDAFPVMGEVQRYQIVFPAACGYARGSPASIVAFESAAIPVGFSSLSRIASAKLSFGGRTSDEGIVDSRNVWESSTASIVGSAAMRR